TSSITMASKSSLDSIFSPPVLLSPEHVELVIGPQSGHIREPVRHGEEGGDGGDVPDVFLFETMRLQSIDIVFLDVFRLAGNLEGKVEHRSEEHTSELQSRENLVCRLLLE